MIIWQCFYLVKIESLEFGINYVKKANKILNLPSVLNVVICNFLDLLFRGCLLPAVMLKKIFWEIFSILLDVFEKFFLNIMCIGCKQFLMKKFFSLVTWLAWLA